MRIKNRKLAELTPYPNNPRINDGAVEAVANSIREFGFLVPIVVDKSGVIVAGHTRYKAATVLGMTEVPTIEAENLTKKQIQAYRLADNKTAEIAEWDFDKLKAELDALDDFDMTQFGNFDFPDEDFGMEEPETEGDDEVPEVQKKVNSKTGEIYELGNSLLICADSTDPETFKRLMGAEKADMVFTDPPYGVSIGDKNKEMKKIKNSKTSEVCVENIANDMLPPEKLYEVLVKAFANAKTAMADKSAYYVTSPQGGGLGMMMMMMMKDAGLEARHVLIWVKNSPTFSLGRLDYDYQHEPILFGWNKTHKKIMGGEHKTSCWFIDKPLASKLHPTMKPIELITNAVLNSSEKNDIILDCFGGSGSTLIAAEKHNRKARLIEIDPHYCDVIRRRWTQWAKENNRTIGSGGLE